MDDSQKAVVIYVDIDDTLIRSVGTKRILMPSSIQQVRDLAEQGAELYCWSSGGAEYARASAQEAGIDSCFSAFLPKPQVFLDDQAPAEWRRTLVVHPSESLGQTVSDYRRKLENSA
jgi:predicted HAD superfamily phosphohydrolase YqeG